MASNIANTKDKLLFWLVGFILFILFLNLVSDILLPFVVGVLVAYFLDPAADKLEDLGFSRTLATVTITGIFFVAVVILVAALSPLLYDQFTALAKNIPSYITSFQEKTAPIIAKLTQELDPDAVAKAKEAASNLSGYVLKFSGELLANLWQSGLAFFNVLSLIFISPVVSFYMLRDWDKIIAKIDGWVPRKHLKTVRQQIDLIDQTMSGYIRGQSNVCLILGAFYAIALTLVGLDFGLFIGMATGILAFIPFVGLLIGMATGLAVAFFQFGDVNHVAMVAGVFIVGQIIEGNFITPKLVGDKVGLHAVWVIFGLLAGGSMFGFTGVLLAVPVTAIIGVLARFFLSVYLKGEIYKGAPVKKKVVRKK